MINKSILLLYDPWPVFATNERAKRSKATPQRAMGARPSGSSAVGITSVFDVYRWLLAGITT